MFTIFYIFLIFIIIISLLYNIPKTEHFLSKTVELTDLTLNPFIYQTTTPFSKEIFNVLSRHIPIIIKNTNRDTVELISDNSCNIIYQFLKTKKTKYRYITALFPKYLTILTHIDNNILTFDEMINNQSIHNIYILDYKNPEIIKKILTILLNTDRFNYIYIDKLPKKIEKNAYYSLLSSEYNIDIYNLSKSNNFFIIELPERHPNYLELIIEFPHLSMSKYDISFQRGFNKNKIIFSIRDFFCLWSFDYVPDYKVYTLIKTIFENLENIRTGFTSEMDKYIIQYLRPENMIKITIIPNHNGVDQYYRELEIYSHNSNQLCINTISSIRCQPDTLFENRFKLLNLYGTQ